MELLTLDLYILLFPPLDIKYVGYQLDYFAIELPS